MNVERDAVHRQTDTVAGADFKTRSFFWQGNMGEAKDLARRPLGIHTVKRKCLLKTSELTHFQAFLKVAHRLGMRVSVSACPSAVCAHASASASLAWFWFYE